MKIVEVIVSPKNSNQLCIHNDHPSPGQRTDLVEVEWKTLCFLDIFLHRQYVSLT